MTEYLVSLSLLIAAVLMIRGIFRGKVSPRVIYALWLAVVIRMLLPVALFEVDIGLPDFSLAAQIEAPDTQRESVETSAGLTAQVSPGNPTREAVQIEPQAPIISEPDAPIPIDSAAPEESDDVTIANKSSDAAEAPIGIDWGKIAGIIWLVGSVLAAAWVMLTSLSFNYRLHSDRRLRSTIRGTKVYVSGSAGVPCIAGLIPSIYITPETADSQSEALIILHEHTHISHGDHIWSVIRALALIAFWWNPLVWVAAAVSKRDAELACDDAIAAGLDDEARLKYARILLDTLPQKHRFAVGLGSAPMKERILMLTAKRKNSAICMALAVVLALSAAGCSFIGKPKLTLDNIYRQNGFTILSQQKKKLELSFPISELPSYEELSVAEEISVSDKGLAAYRSGVSTIFIEKLGITEKSPAGTDGDALYICFDISHELTDAGTLLSVSRVVNTDGEIKYQRTFAIAGGALSDENGTYPYAVYSMGCGPDNKFSAVIDAGLYAQLSGDLKFSIILNELTYERGSEVKLYEALTDRDSESESSRGGLPKDSGAESGSSVNAGQGPYIGYVADAETPWIELYTEKDGTYVGRIPYEIFHDWPGTDRSFEGWTPGWRSEYIHFYYAEFGSFRWAAAHLTDTVLGSGRKNIATSSDGGETWYVGSTGDDYGGNHVVGIGFVSDRIAFMSFDPYNEYEETSGPVISRTINGGETWERLEIPTPDLLKDKKLISGIPFHDGDILRYPVWVTPSHGAVSGGEMYLVSVDGGLTWEWDTLSVIAESSRASDSFDPYSFASFIPNESAQPLFWHRIHDTNDYLYFCAIRTLDGPMTGYTDDPPKDFAIYHVNSDSPNIIGYIAAELPPEFEYDTVCPVLALDGEGRECEFVLRLSRGSEVFYVSFDNFDSGAANDHLAFTYRGILTSERVNELMRTYPDSFRDTENSSVSSTLADFRSGNPNGSLVYEGYTVEYSLPNPYFPEQSLDFHIHLPQINADSADVEKWNGEVVGKYESEYGDSLRRTLSGSNGGIFADVTYNTVTTGDVVTIYIIDCSGIANSGAVRLSYDISHYDTVRKKFLSTDEFIAYYAKGQFAGYTLSDIVKFMNEHAFETDEIGNPYTITEQDIQGVIPSVFGDGKLDVVFTGYSIEGSVTVRMLLSPYPTLTSISAKHNVSAD
ncbi:MAG: M56 family metallopeptidase, partial [Candidatus Flemingiibacterium sp.]